MPGQFDVDSKGVYRCVPFDEFVWQKHGFGSRRANPLADVTLRQVHSDRVLKADGLADRADEGDALITDHIGRAIGVRTADCVPILLLDPETRAVAAIHAGWRGTAAQIAARTVEKLRQEYGADPANLYAAIGPSIRPCCYEVSAEVAERFLPATGEEKRMLDLPDANRRQLRTAGLSPDRIFDSELCTSCLPGQFFSYRREPTNPGRMLAVISRIA